MVDGDKLTLKDTIANTGAMATGLAIDADAKRLYTTNADGELLTIDTDSNKILSRKKLQDDGKEHFYLNLSTDTAGHRAFITDSKQPEVLVVDIRDGKVLQKSPRRNPRRYCLTQPATKSTSPIAKRVKSA